MWQAKVFLAYASEDRDVAVAVQDAIKKSDRSKAGGKIIPQKWEINSELSESILENVQSAMRERDFGVFIYSPVDGKARDNVVFESGLFIGMKQRDRAIILLPENHAVAPSDLGGIRAVEYPYDELQDAADHPARVDMLDGVGAEIVSRIRKIMAQPPVYQEQEAAEQPQSGARAEQPPTVAETISRGLTALAALRQLKRVVGDVSTGTIVVHATYGIGRVMGFDPEGADPRYVDVQFESGIGRYQLTDLFDPPIDLNRG